MNCMLFLVLAASCSTRIRQLTGLKTDVLGGSVAAEGAGAVPGAEDGLHEHEREGIL